MRQRQHSCIHAVASAGSVLLWLVLSTTPALASVEAELAFHRGVVAFGEESYETARKEFEIVLAEDPGDAVALQYLGMIDQAEGNDAGAIEKLTASVEADAENTDARVDLAAILIKVGRTTEADAQLRMALEIEPDRADARLYLGIIAYRQRSYRAAIGHLKQAKELDPDLEVEANYYLGLAEAFSGDLEASAGAFGVVEQTEPNHPLGRSAASLSRQVKDAKKRIWALGLTGGLEYDSNITVTGDGALQESDGRGVIRLQGDVRAIDKKRGNLDFGYDGYLGLYFHETEFSQQTHLLWTAGSVLVGPVRLSARYDYAFTMLDLTEKFRQLHRLTPAASVPTGSWGVAQVYYQFLYLDYLQPVTDPAFLRDGPSHSVGANEFIFLPEPFSYARLGARFIRYQPDGTEFAYKGFELSAGGGVQLPWESQLSLVYVFQHRKYDDHSVVDPFRRKRHDDSHLLTAEWAVPLGRHFTVSVAGSFTFNGSNIQPFDFNRQIVGTYVSYAF
jgi:tetratricopeptide (TPR) repeat protein